MVLVGGFSLEVHVVVSVGVVEVADDWAPGLVGEVTVKMVVMVVVEAAEEVMVLAMDKDWIQTKVRQNKPR